MNRTRATALTATIVVGLVCAACGGGGNALVLPSGLLALFTADPASSDPRVSMESGTLAGDIFTVEIHANGFVDLYGAAFTLLYDPADATYLGCQAVGSILSTSPGTSNPCNDALVGGAKFTAALENGIAGALNVRASRDGLVPGVANGDGLLLSLTFRAKVAIPAPGSPLTFEAGSSREVQTCPQNLSACSFRVVPWDGGTLTAVDG